MKIKNLSCTQFAGLRDCSISFTDGINVIFGKNESGKSSLVNLLSRTLFQKAKLNGKSDTDFMDLYFPARSRNGAQGDFCDGKVTFQTENGTFVLSKDWSRSDPRCTLSTPDGAIRTQSTIDALLKEQLVYGEGVYAELLLSSQYNTSTALQTILDSKRSDVKQELTEVLSQAFVESKGISVDAIEHAIEEKISKISGKHWDPERNAPKRTTGRWANSLGEILTAYYNMEDAKKVLADLSMLEQATMDAANRLSEADGALADAKEHFNRFSGYANDLMLQKMRNAAIKRLEADLHELQAALQKWPQLDEKLSSAKALRSERRQAECLQTYRAAKAVSDRIGQLESTLPDPQPEKEEIAQLKDAQRRLMRLEGRLCGMNLLASIHMHGNHQVQITSVLSGKPIALENGLVSITEAVRISVENMMDMQLSPADVDVAKVEDQIAVENGNIRAILDKYAVQSLEELENLSQSISETKRRIDDQSRELTRILGKNTLQQLQETAGSQDVRSVEELDEVIQASFALPLETFIAQAELTTKNYEEKYGSIAELEAMVAATKQELEEKQADLPGEVEIPEEYRAIADPKAHLERLEQTLNACQGARDEAFSENSRICTQFEVFQKNLPDDPRAEAEQAEQIYKETEALLAHWLHIREVFEAQKQELKDSPLQDLADRFSHYLGLLSKGGVSTEFPDADKLNMQIFSHNKLLDFGKLSEGTKETVSLAFRLSVLDHLFPDGGGMIVFDDPLTDMDADRVRQACTLIKECAQKHQVIFLTCHEEYAPLLDASPMCI